MDTETLKPIEDPFYVLKMEMIPMEEMQEIIRVHGNAYLKKLYDEAKETREVCIKSGISGIDKYVVTGCGQRHNLQVKVAVYARLMGNSRSGVIDAQMDWYWSQNPEYIGSSEDEVRYEANMIANWVMGHVAPLQCTYYSGNDAPDAVITKRDLPYIIGCKNKTQRKIAFLIWVYCRRYGRAKLALKTISEKIGVSDASVASAIKSLISQNVIQKEHSTIDKQTAFLIRSSNVYKLPRLLRREPVESECLADSIHVTDWLRKETFNDAYMTFITGICSDEYLSKYLKKPEMAEVKQWREEHDNVRASAADCS